MKRVTTNRFGRAVAHGRQTIRAMVALGMAAMLVSSCDVHRISSAGSLATLSISPNPQTITVNGTQQYTATGLDESGAVVAITPVWSVVAGGGAIRADGMFTAGSTPNTFTNTIQVTSGGMTATATVVVVAGSLATITVTPTPVTLGTSAGQQFTAVGKDAIGNVIPIVPVWSVVAGGGTIVTTTGLFTSGTTAGTFTNTVRASIGTIAGFATVIVTSGALANINVTPNPVTLQANGTQQFVATGTDASGNAFVITPVWSVVNGGGTINASTGVFTAGLTAGTFTNTVKATSGTVSGTATVTVTVPSPS